MAIAEQLVALDSSLLEIQAEGGQVWVEGEWGRDQCLICFHFAEGGSLGEVSVMIPDVDSRKVHALARTMRDAWKGEVVSHGTIVAKDPRRISGDFSSAYVTIVPSRGGREAVSVLNMRAVANSLDSVLGKPGTVILARVVHSG